MDALDETTPAAPRRSGIARALYFIVFGIVVPGVVVLVGWRVASDLLASRPEAKRKPPTRAARLVEVEPVRFGPHRTEIDAMGTVGPARTLTVHARVGGEVKEVGDGLIPGGHLGVGDRIVLLDATDHEILVAQRATDVARAESDLVLEKGQQAVALREFELLGEGVTPEEKALVLREPQLAAVKARLAAARSALRQAELDRDRTEVKALFPAIVRQRFVEVGAQVAPSTPIAEIVGSEDFWIEVSVPVDRLRWIRIPETPDGIGSTVTIRDDAAWGPGRTRTGKVLRLLGDLEPQGRMARLLVSVRDPLALEKGNEGLPQLLLGSYVRVTVTGRELPSVARIPRARIRGGDSVWILDRESRLEIRPVEIVFRTTDAVCVASGLLPEDRIVVTDLSAPVEGMLLRTAEPDEGDESARPEPIGETEDSR